MPIRLLGPEIICHLPPTLPGKYTPFRILYLVDLMPEKVTIEIAGLIFDQHSKLDIVMPHCIPC
jgi:hypothetical protein